MDTELRAAYQGYTQALLPLELTKKLDAAGTTNIMDQDRLTLLSGNELASIIDIYGENGKQAQLRIGFEVALAEEGRNSPKREKAIRNILSKNTKEGRVQGASVFDFDKTVGISRNYVQATKPGEKPRRLNATQFAKEGLSLMDQGWEMDFTDFNRVTKGEKGPLFQKLKNQIEKYGTDNVYILTARHADSALAIQAWLSKNGIDLPLANIKGLGDSTGEAKANWIEESLIWNGFNDIYFVDDHVANVQAVQNMFNTYPEGVLVQGGKAVIAKASKTKTDKKVIFMVGGAGAGKTTVLETKSRRNNGTYVEGSWIIIRQIYL